MNENIFYSTADKIILLHWSECVCKGSCAYIFNDFFCFLTELHALVKLLCMLMFLLNSNIKFAGQFFMSFFKLYCSSRLVSLTLSECSKYFGEET